MKRHLLACTLLAAAAIPAFSFAQVVEPPESPKYSASLAFDTKLKATPVVTAKLRTFSDVFDKKGLTLDLDAFIALDSNIRLGFGLTHTFSFVVPFSRELRPKLDLTVGPWCNYGTGSGKLAGGLYVGFGGTF